MVFIWDTECLQVFALVQVKYAKTQCAINKKQVSERNEGFCVCAICWEKNDDSKRKIEKKRIEVAEEHETPTHTNNREKEKKRKYIM